MNDKTSGEFGLRGLLVLALLTATPPLSTAMYLASFPKVRSDFHTDSASVQLTMTAFLFGIAIGQVAWSRSHTGTGGASLSSSDALARRSPRLFRRWRRRSRCSS